MKIAQSSAVFTVTLFVCCAANSQEVIEKNFSTGIRSIERHAAERSVALPLVSAGEAGTVVVTHYSHHRMLVDIVGKREDSVELLAAAKTFATAASVPRADLTIHTGTAVSAVRINLSDHLPNGRRRSFELALATLRESLRGVSQPVWLAIAPEQNAELWLGDRAINDWTFVPLDEVGEDKLLFKSEVPWYAPIVLVTIALLMITASFTICKQIIFGEKKKPIRSDEIADPETVQQTYERTRHHIWLALAFVLLLFVGGYFLVVALPASLNAIENPLWTALPMFVMLGAIPLALIVRWIRGAKPGANGGVSPTTRKLVLLMASFSWMAVTVIASLAMLFIAPDALRGNPKVALFIIASAPILGVATFVVGKILMNRKYNVPLPDGHPLREFALATARENGTKLREIYTTDLPGANALMTLSGNLALSDDLIANLDQAELRAIVAHEIGHQRRKDSIRLLFYSFAILAVVLLCYEWLAARLEGSTASLQLLFVFAAITPLIPYIMLGKRRRQAELEADRFAVKVTKDPELVIRALRKVTHLNEVPFKLARLDEALSTHPSLESRIDAIRAFSRER